MRIAPVPARHDISREAELVSPIADFSSHKDAKESCNVAHPIWTWLEHRGPALTRLCVYATAVFVAGPFFYHVAHNSNAFLGLLEDDHYYYSIVADNLIRAGKLSYDGTTVTNGFHPFWFAIVVLLRALFGRFGSAFYVALTVVSVVSMIATYELGRIFASTLGASRNLASIAAGAYSFGTAQLVTNGMESVIAVPLFLWLLIELAQSEPVTIGRAAKLGFVSSLAILARLDIALLVPLFISAFLVIERPPLRTFVRLLLAFCAAGVLVPVYAIANFQLVGSLFPVSALAKRLVTTPGFSLAYARGIAFGTMYGATVGFVLPIGAFAWLGLKTREKVDRPVAYFVCGLTLAFAFLFFGINALSGWIVFGWYTFPLVPATIVAIVCIVKRWGAIVGPKMQVVTATLVIAAAPAQAVRYYVQHGPLGSISDNTLVAMSYDLKDHLKGRHGLFAMGAIAGIAAYVIDEPVLQLEGIIADRRMVDHVRQQHELADVLREYGADFLIVSLATTRAQSRDGCYLVTQPNDEWAGTRTAKMRGEICTEPIEHFFTANGSSPWAIFPTIETLVWDLHGARWKSSLGGREVVAESTP
jgi:hypothetical protein